jgi:hypothetical protein
MTADIITFESDYMRAQANTVAEAKKLIDEACASLKKANRHDGWRCSEREQINSSLHDVSTRLGKLCVGLESISSTLNNGAGQFADLESRAQKEEGALSGRLKENWGFEALKWIAGVIGGIGQKVGDFLSGILPVTPVPPSPSPMPPVTVAPPSEGETAIMPDAPAPNTGTAWNEVSDEDYQRLRDAVKPGEKGGQCKVYVDDLLRKLTGIDLPATRNPAGGNYKDPADGSPWSTGYSYEAVGADPIDGLTKIDQLLAKDYTDNVVSNDVIKQKFEELASKGDMRGVVLQIGNNGQSNSTLRVHTALIESVTDEGIIVTDSNYPKGEKIREGALMTWEQLRYYLNTEESGFTLYMPDYTKRP